MAKRKPKYVYKGNVSGRKHPIGSTRCYCRYDLDFKPIVRCGKIIKENIAPKFGRGSEYGYFLKVKGLGFDDYKIGSSLYNTPKKAEEKCR